MSGYESHRNSQASVGQRDTRVSWYSNGRCNPRYHLKPDPSFPQSKRLFSAATEDEGVPTLEANHQRMASFFHQQGVDLFLTHSVVPGFLSLRRLEGLVGRAIDEPEDIESVGGLVAHLHDGEMERGATVTWDGIDLVVRRVEDGRPARIYAARPPKKKR